MGDIYATAKVGERMFIWEGTTTSTAPLVLTLENPYLIPNLNDPEGHPLTSEDGTPLDVPYFTSTSVRVLGPPNSEGTVTINPGSQFVQIWGLNENGKVHIDSNGLGVFYVGVLPDVNTSAEIQISVQVNPEGTTLPFITDVANWGNISQAWIGFWGGDTENNAGMVGGVVGGFLVVGDIGVIVKNLFRKVGWSEEEVNSVETSLAMIGIGGILIGPADGFITFLRVIVQRFGDTPFTRMLLKRAIDVVKGTKSITEAEEGFFNLLKNNDSYADSFSKVAVSEELWEASVRSADHLGENFSQAVKNAVDDYSELAAKKLVETTAGFSDDVLASLKASPDLDDALEGLVKVLDEGINPELVKKALNNANVFGSQYRHANLLMDIGEVSTVKGLDLALDTLKSTARGINQTKGYRYEIEGAAELVRQGHNVVEFSKRVNVPWDDAAQALGKTGRTDIDVVVSNGADLFYYQFKRSTIALRTLKHAQAWVTKALLDLDEVGNYSRVIYAMPNGANDLTSTVKKWFDSLNPPITTISIQHLD
ncbi:hypothetical protein QEH52_11115 [Coraliomargarita sp. SDUM461003]|uniref:Tox-REase-7 domain-containing protein n=1 Tax=Thalassobacterium maritimum TaxID=3041265 RepID=A0ABU1AV84_9BACT|nr:hypothetical protein [Coraliomargarita sp. SDUM461003]MDQ8208061.1 hypothetical protein [Coraliomargarita sp. SDUM461003]